MKAMAITTTSISHVRLTVTDIARSRQFYDSVFGWPVLLEVPDDADAETREKLWFLFGGVIYRAGDSFVMKPGYVGVWKTIETVRKIYVTVG